MVMRLRAPYGVELWGWRIFLLGYALLAASAGIYYWGQWTSYNALEDAVGLWMYLPGALLGTIGSTVLGIGLLRRRVRPWLAAVLLVLTIPGLMLISEVTSLGNADLPIMFAIAMLAGGDPARRGRAHRGTCDPRGASRHNDRVTQARSSAVPAERGDLDEAEVSPLELFFDLVFVFALTQVTAYMAHEIDAGHGLEGLVRGVMILALLWWAWTGYAWLANVSSVEQPALKLTILVGMSAMFVLALCIPEAFEDGDGGLDGPLVLALAYLLVRAMHFVMFWLVAREDPTLRGQLARFAPSVAGSSIVLIVASQFEGDTQTALWALALVVDYVGTWLGGASGWRLPSPGHFSERHGLIVIIALGESIVAIGVGVGELPITWPILVAAALGLLLASAMWWAYFDVSALLGERALATEPVETRARLGRTAFSFAHLPLVAAVVVVALGLKKVLEYVSDTEQHDLSDPLKGVALGALVGGVAVYLAAHVLFKWLVIHKVSRLRLGAVAVLLVLWVPIKGVPALGQLGVGPGSSCPRWSSSPSSTPRAVARSDAS